MRSSHPIVCILLSEKTKNASSGTIKKPKEAAENAVAVPLLRFTLMRLNAALHAGHYPHRSRTHFPRGCRETLSARKLNFRESLSLAVRRKWVLFPFIADGMQL